MRSYRAAQQKCLPSVTGGIAPSAAAKQIIMAAVCVCPQVATFPAKGVQLREVEMHDPFHTALTGGSLCARSKVGPRYRERKKIENWAWFKLCMDWAWLKWVWLNIVYHLPPAPTEDHRHPDVSVGVSSHSPTFLLYLTVLGTALVPEKSTSIPRP